MTSTRFNSSQQAVRNKFNSNHLEAAEFLQVSIRDSIWFGNRCSGNVLVQCDQQLTRHKFVSAGFGPGARIVDPLVNTAAASSDMVQEICKIVYREPDLSFFLVEFCWDLLVGIGGS
jgi:hypothetical protein